MHTRWSTVGRLISAMTVFCLTAGANGLAQSHPDLSGTWTIDEARSDPPPNAGPARGNAGGRGGRANVPSNQLVIAQTPSEVSIARGALNITYKFDGTETFFFQAGEVRSTAAWEGSTLVISWKRERFDGPAKGYVTITGVDRYSLDGSVLTQESMTVTPEGSLKRKTLYTK
jgi:hypothetical protein